MFAEKVPNARILELGAGSGGCTGAILKGLCDVHAINDLSYSQFDFTDISSGFFEEARYLFGDRVQNIAYRKLDIEEDPVQQGFETESYDLVIACGVLHATKILRETLKNVRKLLKPGGRLLLVEVTRDTVELPMIFGTELSTDRPAPTHVMETPISWLLFHSPKFGCDNENARIVHVNCIV